MVDGGEVEIEVPLVALAASMTCCSVGGIRSHPFVSFSALYCAAAMGWSDSAFYSLVATSLKTPMRLVWYCVAVFDVLGRLFPGHRRNHTSAYLYMQRYNGAAMNVSDLNYTA